jgi:hypothetical protein
VAPATAVDAYLRLSVLCLQIIHCQWSYVLWR